jgi:glycosyltransferase involved in cell wall biosynthesis
MKEPTISLIIPAYNEDKYIGVCLEYAIKNSGNKFHEIIVVDNGSTDQTENIAKNFDGVKFVKEIQKGVMHARQRGYMESSGDLIAFIDADTRVPVGWYERILKEFEGNKNLACLSGRNSYYDLSWWQNFWSTMYWLLAMPVYYCVGYMAIFNNFVIRRDVIIKMGGLDTSIAFYGDDTNTSRRAHKFGKAKFSLSFVMPVSGRRFSNKGFISSTIPYIKNYFSEVFIHKPITKSYEDVR